MGASNSCSFRKDVVIVSPSLQMLHQHRLTVLKTICSGHFGTFGHCPPCDSEQLSRALLCSEITGVSHLKDNFFTEVSQGEQRRVLFARALMCRPKLLLLDEPFHGLCAEGRADFLAIINDLIRSNYCTVIFVSHHNDEVPSALTHELCLIPSPSGSIGTIRQLM